MVDEPRNEASEWWRVALESLTGIGRPDALRLLRQALTEDFVWEDRKRVVGFAGGDADAFVEAFGVYYDVADELPRFIVDEVISVRGQTLALAQARASYSEAWDSSFLAVIVYNRRASALERAIAFDVEDRLVAVEELERLHAEFDRD